MKYRGDGPTSCHSRFTSPVEACQTIRRPDESTGARWILREFGRSFSPRPIFVVCSWSNPMSRTLPRSTPDPNVSAQPNLHHCLFVARLAADRVADPIASSRLPVSCAITHLATDSGQPLVRLLGDDLCIVEPWPFGRYMPSALSGFVTQFVTRSVFFIWCAQTVVGLNFSRQATEFS
jgi:hypothetical protein